jgi:hypothetical protein
LEEDDVCRELLILAHTHHVPDPDIFPELTLEACLFEHFGVRVVDLQITFLAFLVLEKIFGG